VTVSADEIIKSNEIFDNRVFLFFIWAVTVTVNNHLSQSMECFNQNINTLSSSNNVEE